MNVAGLRKLFSALIMMAGLTAGLGVSAAWAQMLEPGTQSQAPNPLTDPTMKPGKILLYDLEARFAKDVLEQGGAGFAAWFAEDGVALGNGAAPLIGKVAIAKSANWLPQNYQLTWTPTDAMMGPSGDMGYTWGHFEGQQQGRERQSCADERTVHHHVAQRAGRQLEGGAGRGRQRASCGGRLLQAARTLELVA